jgi:hypothetical protein
LTHRQPVISGVVAWWRAGQPDADGDRGVRHRSALALSTGLPGTVLPNVIYGTTLLLSRAADWNASVPTARINPVSQASADFRLDQRLAAICAAMKNPDSTLANGDDPDNHRVRIHVIGFEVANATHGTMLQNCARADPDQVDSPDRVKMLAKTRGWGRCREPVRTETALVALKRPTISRRPPPRTCGTRSTRSPIR